MKWRWQANQTAISDLQRFEKRETIFQQIKWIWSKCLFFRKKNGIYVIEHIQANNFEKSQPDK